MTGHETLERRAGRIGRTLGCVFFISYHYDEYKCVERLNLDYCYLEHKMDVIIDKARPEEASAMLDYLKRIGGESDNLSFGAEGLLISVEDERKYIQSMSNAKNSIFLLAKEREKIIGHCSLLGFSRRFSHRGELSIAVVKEYWHMGVGSALLHKALYFAKSELALEVVSLEVRSDNKAAIHLYKKMGFRYIGTYEKFFKTDDGYFSADFMSLYL